MNPVVYDTHEEGALVQREILTTSGFVALQGEHLTDTSPAHTRVVAQALEEAVQNGITSLKARRLGPVRLVLVRGPALEWTLSLDSSGLWLGGRHLALGVRRVR